ncbi:phage tail protein [Algoriphagus sp. Y33]|uniref:phage tail protein n=1 Tax=Algoriphagus sp. Y33 TaxID=2772483 RepID=UPI0017861EC1|nr:tail fiber protein [Algoriphagus sp. Y33]
MEGTISEIRYFGPSWAPRNWMICNGALLPINQYSAFFSLIGTTYGGDGMNTFAIPDLRGRVAVGEGAGPGLTPRRIGEASGVEHVTLLQSEMPSHSHGAVFSGHSTIPVNITVGDEDESNPGSGVLANTGNDQYSSTPSSGAMYSGAPIAVNGTVTVGVAGGSQAHENMQPWLCITPIICSQGIFPSRP